MPGIGANVRMRSIAVMSATVLTLSACSTADPPPSQQAADGLAHIHGLGVNPADGVLYAGTHFGVYRLAAGSPPERVGNVVQDFMGFTVIGPNHFLGSGHPAERSADQPPNLGLIESTDGAHSWTPISLSGTADFHALRHRGGLTVGLDSTTRAVLVSTDTHTWQARATLAGIDIALSPGNPNELLVTTPQGLVRSRDQARTFAPVEGAPPLVFLAWPHNGPLLGVDSSGSVHASSDAGATWQQRGQLGQQPQALTIASDGVAYIATETALRRSTDGGTTFEKLQTLAES